MEEGDGDSEDGWLTVLYADDRGKRHVEGSGSDPTRGIT
jgi:hypothetical protein